MVSGTGEAAPDGDDSAAEKLTAATPVDPPAPTGHAADAAQPLPGGPAPVDVQEVGLMQQAIRFLGTGVMSAIVDFGTLLILMTLGVGYTPAKAVSFILGTITAYTLNRRFTFKAQPSRRRFILTMVTYAVTFVLQVGIFSWVFPLLAAERLPQLAVQTISFVFGQGAATIANFAMQRWVIFRPTRGVSARPDDGAVSP